MAALYGKEGKDIGHAVDSMNANVRPEVFEQVLKTGIPMHQELELKPGAYLLRLGVMDRSTRKIGTVDVPLNNRRRAKSREVVKFSPGETGVGHAENHLLVATCVLLGIATAEAPQQPMRDGGGDRLNPEIKRLHEQIYRDQAKKRLDSLKSDTERLAQLSQELKKSVDGVNPDAMLSVEVIKKADEIARLAKAGEREDEGAVSQ